MTIILFIYKYLWLISLIMLYAAGWIYAIRQIKAELRGAEIYDSIFNPFPFYVFWICLHTITLIASILCLIISSFNYWLTGNISFYL